MYFWIINKVTKDHFLNIDYRYVPIWRYKFETKHTELKSVYDETIENQSVYSSLGNSFNVSSYDYSSTLNRLSSNLEKLKNGQSDLNEISKVLPSSINKNDVAYIAYTKLNNEYKNEIEFQEKFSKILKSFQSVNQTTDQFIQSSTGTIDVLSSNAYSSNIKTKLKSSLKSKLRKVVDALDSRLRNINSAQELNWNTQELVDLAKSVGSNVRETQKLHQLLKTNNYVLKELNSIKSHSVMLMDMY